MSIDINWIHLVAALVLGFLFKVLFDELKSPRIRIVGVSRQPYTISPEIQVIGDGFDNYYTAYRIRVENKQKRYLHSAAENCMAWIELDDAPEPYQISWIGSGSEAVINVGDIREVDFCARGNTTGKIYAPTERGYFKPEPRKIGDGNSDLLGKLRITSKNGRKEEKRFIIRPRDNQLEIGILDGKSRGNNMVNSTENGNDIINQIKTPLDQTAAAEPILAMDRFTAGIQTEYVTECPWLADKHRMRPFQIIFGNKGTMDFTFFLLITCTTVTSPETRKKIMSMTLPHDSL